MPNHKPSAVWWRYALGLVFGVANFAGLSGPSTAQPLETLVAPEHSETESSHAFPKHRLRIEWRSETEEKWSGRVSVSRGRLTQLGRLQDNRGASPDAHIEAGALEVHQQHPSKGGVLHVSLQAPLDAVLQIVLARDEGPSAPETAGETLELTVAEIVRHSLRKPLGISAGSLFVEHIEADKLRVRTERQSMIFAPSEAFSFDIEAVLPGLEAGSPLDLSVELRSARTEKPQWSAPLQRKSAPVSGNIDASISVPLPSEEGVYTLRLAAIQPPGSVKAWLPGSQGKILAEREFQVVVFDPDRQPTIPSAWRQIEEIDPTSKQWWRRLPKLAWLSRAPWLPEGPLGSSPAEIVAGAAGPLVQLPPIGEGSPPWQAYPLPVKAAGKPYLIEVEYPADQPQQLVLTVMDKNRQGAAGPLGDSLRVAVSEPLAASNGLKTVRRLVWPKSQSPLLVLSNGSQESPARFGRIRVLSVADTETVGAPKQPSGWNFALVSTSNLPTALGVTFSGKEERVDWQSWYESSGRLADWLALSGFDGAAVTVETATGAIYPSEVFAAQPERGMTGSREQETASAAIDLPGRDALELLLCEFDRRGLKLTPILCFESILTVTQRLRLQQSFGRKQPLPSDSPYEEETRREMAAAIRELVDRYGHHESFAGVALNLSDRSCLISPPLATGPDKALFAQFLSETKLQWPSAAPHNRETYQAAIEGPWSEVWQKWRMTVVSRLVQSLADTLNADQPRRPLLLLSHEWILSHRVAARLIPRIDHNPDCEAALIAAGIDREAMETMAGVTFVEPRYQTGVLPLEEEAIRLVANAGFATRPEKAGGVALVSSKMTDTLTSFEQASPFGVAKTDATIRIANLSEANLDSLSAIGAEGPPTVLLEGGDTLPLVVNERIASLRRAISSLPERNRGDRVIIQEPMVVRRTVKNGAAMLIVSNPSPWRVEANLTLRLDEPGVATILPEANRSSRNNAESHQQFGAGEHVFPIALEAYESRTLRFDRPSVEPLGVRLQVADQAQAKLRDQIADLRNRDLSARSRFDKCPNPSFEAVDFEGNASGWVSVGVGPRSTVGLTKDEVADGANAIRFTSAGASAGLRSDPFPMPPTGQLALKLRVRAERLSPQAQLLITFEQTDGDYRSYTTIPAERLQQKTGQWQPFIFPVDELPVAANLTMRVRFDLQGAGQIEIDHLEFYDLVFPLEFLRGESAKNKLALLRTIYAAESALEAGRLNTCRTMLAGYWPRFLQQYTPLSETERVAAQEAPQQSPVEPESAEEKPGIGERLKGYLPGFMRF